METYLLDFGSLCGFLLFSDNLLERTQRSGRSSKIGKNVAFGEHASDTGALDDGGVGYAFQCKQSRYRRENGP